MGFFRSNGRLTKMIAADIAHQASDDVSPVSTPTRLVQWGVCDSFVEYTWIHVMHRIYTVYVCIYVYMYMCISLEAVWK